MPRCGLDDVLSPSLYRFTDTTETGHNVLALLFSLRLCAACIQLGNLVVELRLEQASHLVLILGVCIFLYVDETRGEDAQCPPFL
jgi:hypothetical protein